MASRATGVLASQFMFDGSEDKYDLWETRLLSHLHTLKLKETILHEPIDADAEQLAEDRRKNSDCYAGLPDSFKPLAVHITQNEDDVTFTDFKRRLRIYEEAEKMKGTESTDNVMKGHTRLFQVTH